LFLTDEQVLPFVLQDFARSIWNEESSATKHDLLNKFKESSDPRMSQFLIDNSFDKTLEILYSPQCLTLLPKMWSMLQAGIALGWKPFCVLPFAHKFAPAHIPIDTSTLDSFLKTHHATYVSLDRKAYARKKKKGNNTKGSAKNGKGKNGKKGNAKNEKKVANDGKKEKAATDGNEESKKECRVYFAQDIWRKVRKQKDVTKDKALVWNTTFNIPLANNARRRFSGSATTDGHSISFHFSPKPKKETATETGKKRKQEKKCEGPRKKRKLNNNNAASNSAPSV